MDKRLNGQCNANPSPSVTSKLKLKTRNLYPPSTFDWNNWLILPLISAHPSQAKLNHPQNEDLNQQSQYYCKLIPILSKSAQIEWLWCKPRNEEIFFIQFFSWKTRTHEGHVTHVQMLTYWSMLVSSSGPTCAPTIRPSVSLFGDLFQEECDTPISTLFWLMKNADWNADWHWHQPTQPLLTSEFDFTHYFIQILQKNCNNYFSV